MSSSATTTSSTGTSESASEDPTTKKKVLESLGYPSMNDFTARGYELLKEGIRCSNGLPCGKERNFFAIDESFKKITYDEGNRVMKLMNNILRCHDVDGNVRNKLLDKLELIVEANDVILEKVANNIDELNGIKKSVCEPVVLQTVSAHLPLNGSWNRRANTADTTFSVNSSADPLVVRPATKSVTLLAARNIIRPQKFFKDKINNNNKPWEPRITDKPNSLKPLAIFLEETEHGEEYSHAYEFELQRFTPSEEQLKNERPIEPKPLSETPLIEITEPEQLDNLVETLRGYKEIAVDLEHHSFRTYMGITCLLQISTRDSDYLVDALALRDKLHILNEIFTKPSILKIFHGADSDIQWLQRDLSLYIVNMFDTFQAAKILEYQTLSLQFLLGKFCNVSANKKYQLADWRIRPLPDELKQYAREDTHYLIYIYQMMKKELLRKGNGEDNFLLSAFNKSTLVCLKRYRKPILTEESHMDFYRKCKRHFDNRQLYALKELYKWRDTIARNEDESCGYVLPNHMLLQLSETLPREMQGILACCTPPPPLVKSNLLELHNIIRKARDQPLVQPILTEDSRARGSTIERSKIDVNSPLHCSHDLTKYELRDNLPTLLANTFSNNDLKEAEELLKTESGYAIFNTDIDEQIESDKVSLLKKIKFLSPYQRYFLAKPIIQAEEDSKTDEAAAEKSEPNKPPVSKDVIETSAKLNLNVLDRTDEERIASVKEHYLSLHRMEGEEGVGREAEQQIEVDRNETLLGMGGSKKRKRESDDAEDEREVNQQFETPVPNKYIARKKRKPNYHYQHQHQNQNDANMNQSGYNPAYDRPTKNKYSWKKNQESVGNVQRGPEGNQPPPGKFKNKKRPVKNQNRSVYQGGNQRDAESWQVPYDYGSVDFQQFKGGARAANMGREITSNFKVTRRGGKNGNNNKKRKLRSLNRERQGQGNNRQGQGNQCANQRQKFKGTKF